MDSVEHQSENILYQVVKRLFVAILLVAIPFCGLLAGNSADSPRCDGGMMLHAGYLSGDIAPLGYKASGVPFGIGGVARYHLGSHWRVGAEGYVSTLKQMDNGSYVKYGWGGVLGDFYWILGKLMPFAGLTLGGGAVTDFLMMEGPEEEWQPVKEAYYHKQGFFAVDPFVGCDFIVSKGFHLTLKLDFLSGFGKDLQMPTGPRLYFGFIFYH